MTVPLWLAIAFTVVGSWIGFFFAALLCAAGRSEDALELRGRGGLEGLELDPLMESEEAGEEPARR